MSQSRLVQVADIIAEAVPIGPFTDPALTPKKVRRCWQFDYRETDTALSIFVIPMGYEFIESASRAHNLYEYKIGFIVLERYTKPTVVPDEWVDERVKWIETYIWDRFSDPRTFDTIVGARPESGEVVSFDPEFLREKKLFYSDVSMSFRQEQ